MWEVGHRWVHSLRGISLLSVQFCCGPKTVLKDKIYLKNILKLDINIRVMKRI